MDSAQTDSLAQNPIVTQYLRELGALYPDWEIFPNYDAIFIPDAELINVMTGKRGIVFLGGPEKQYLFIQIIQTSDEQAAHFAPEGSVHSGNRQHIWLPEDDYLKIGEQLREKILTDAAVWGEAMLTEKKRIAEQVNLELEKYRENMPSLRKAVSMFEPETSPSLRERR